MVTGRDRELAWLIAQISSEGPWDTPEMSGRLSGVLALDPELAEWLARTITAKYSEAPAQGELIRFVLSTRRIQKRLEAVALTVRADPPRPMQPARGTPSAWAPPALPTAGDLAAYLGLSTSALLWFADARHWQLRARGRLAHYVVRFVQKPAGGVRVVEAPKARLRALQRRVLRGILSHAPPHDAAHGFRAGRSVHSFVLPHVAQELVMRIDLKHFFGSVRAARVGALFRTMGYPDAVAKLLTGLCTHAVPGHAWQDAPRPPTAEALQERARDRRFFRTPHLPAGAPTSPALANLAAYRLDLRLAALSHAAGAAYSRYADDLAFSGDERFARRSRSFFDQVRAVAEDEGFRAHSDKTRRMRAGARQELAGVVVNRRVNVRRADYDRLKAVLTNCARHGPAGQNRDGRPAFRDHLLGRVSWVRSLHPARGDRLLDIFRRIDWDEPS
jgi:RNA-directed DNA polymerase